MNRKGDISRQDLNSTDFLDTESSPETKLIIQIKHSMI